MGNVISISDSIAITIFSMVVVFVGLIVLALLISVLKKIGAEKTTVEKVTQIVKEDSAVDKIEENKAENIANDEELVAVIAAAVAASLGLSIPEINIKSIRRVAEEGPLWSQAGKQERIFGKL